MNRRVAAAGAALVLLGLAAALYFITRAPAERVAIGSAGGDARADEDTRRDTDDAEPSHARPSAKRAVLVEVVDKRTRAPVAGAAVRVSGLSAQAVATGRTDESGVVELNVPVGARLVVSAFGYTDGRFLPPPMLPDGASWTVHLERNPQTDAAGARFGVVMDAAGQGVDDAFVVQRDGDTMLNGLEAAAGGRFSVPEDATAGQIFEAFSPGHGHAEATLDANADLVIRLPDAGALAGTVHLSDGTVPEHITVRVFAPDLSRRRDKLWRSAGRLKGGRGTFLQNRLRAMKTDARFELTPDEAGAFVTGALAAGKTNVIVSSGDYVPDEKSGLRIAGGNTLGGLTFILKDAPRITGTVSDLSTGEPVAGVRIRTEPRPRGTRFGEATSGSDGTFSIPVQDAGRYTLLADKRGFAAFSQGGIFTSLDAPAEREIALRKLGAGERQKRAADYVGIGTVVKKVEGGVLVQDLIEGGAASGQLKAGDIIRRADGEWLDQSSLRDAVQLLLGEQDTDVELLIQRPGLPPGEDEIEVTLQRRRIKR